MANYVIGDIQGCYDPLLRLLDQIHFDDKVDRLWFVGDLVNRGPNSLAVLRFIKQLTLTPRIVLGNHDLHLLNCIFNPCVKSLSQETFQDVLKAPDKEELGHWLLKQPLLFYDETLQTVMCHAGIYPLWDLEQAIKYAQFFESHLQGSDYKTVLSHLYGNTPSLWSENLSTFEKLRFICNALTRMRFCDEQGHLLLEYKGTIEKAPNHHFPWYAVPSRCIIKQTIVFGHWAALQGNCPVPNIYAIDTGCVWGGPLTALRLEDKQRLIVPGV